MTGESSQKHPGPHRIDAFNRFREDAKRVTAEQGSPLHEGFEHFKPLGMRGLRLTSAESEEFSPSFAQKIMDGDRFRNGILESERMPVRALGVAVVVMYAHTTGFLDEIKERIGN